MKSDTFEKTLKGFSERVPFRPFTVELINGRQFAINHPEALVVRSGVAVYIDPDGALVIFDHEGVNQFTGSPEPRMA